ncbi:MAG: hypothetical protein JNN15_15030 [Blastocatellia bacterium]|nr:hypothetical protein [Blastocatellia bacterium]
MYSISSNWGKQFKDEEFFFDFDDTKNFPESSYLPSQEEKVFAKQMEDKINRLFEDDPLVTIIICELKDGSKLRAIREKYKISDNDYEAAMKRMRRKLARLYEGDEHV